MRIFSLIAFCLPALAVLANAEDFLYSSGKIWVVAIVLLIIFLGIVLYLFRLDRKISKLEKKNEA